MPAPNARRTAGELSTEAKERLKKFREQIAQELPDLIARNQMCKDAREEPTISGQLRNAVHASKRPLKSIAEQIGITPLMLSEFLTGERTLRSDVMDRLAIALGYKLQSATSA